MPVAKVVVSRVAEVAALLDLMKVKGVATLKVGDIELTMAQVAASYPEDEKPRYVSPEEAEQKARDRRRELMLASSGRIVGRVGG